MSTMHAPRRTPWREARGPARQSCEPHAFHKSGKVDLVFASLAINDGRKKGVDSSTPYLGSGTQLIAKMGVLKTPHQPNSRRIRSEKSTPNAQLNRAGNAGTSDLGCNWRFEG